MQETKDVTEINGVVEYVNATRFWVRYSFKDESYRIEIPRTDINKHFEIGDSVEMQMFILVERKEDVEEE